VVSEVGSWKWLEAGLLAAAGGLFVWWQLRDVNKALAASRARREAEVQGPPDGEPRP
jgi:hypothetical protein